MGAKPLFVIDPPDNGEMPDLQALLDQLEASMPAGKVDKALARLAEGGLMGLVATASEGTLAAALAAIDPTLTLSDVDAACGKLEDLAILLLSQARCTRHEVSELADRHAASTPSGKVLAKQALDVLDELGAAGALEEDEIATNRKLIASLAGGGGKRTRKTAAGG